MQYISTFLMFSGNAGEAIDHYLSAFTDASIVNISRYGAGEGGVEGTVKHATFLLKGQQFMAIDSNAAHGFTFTPAMSLFVGCDSEEEIDGLYEKLSEGGQVMMAPGAYPFSKKYAWISDKFGVSWQLSLNLAV